MPFNPKVAFYSGQTQNIDYTPGADVAAGAIVALGALVCFAQRDIPANTPGSLAASGGVWQGNKVNGTIAGGDAVYYNTVASPQVGTAASGAFQNTPPASGYFVGYAVSAAAANDQYVYFVKTPSPASGLRSVSGQLTTVTAADTIVTGLSKVVAVVATLDSDLGDNPEFVSATIGDQAGTPASGSIIIKTWQNTSGTDPTPVAATTFGKKVNWVAFGY